MAKQKAKEKENELQPVVEETQVEQQPARTEQMQQQLRDAKGKNDKSGSIRESSSSSVAHSGLPEDAPERAQQIADEFANNSEVAQALLNLSQPEKPVESPDDAIKRENKKKNVLLLQQMLQTIMGGVAANNNSRVPNVDNTSAINTVNGRIAQLKNEYQRKLALQNSAEIARQKQAFDLAKEKDRIRREAYGDTLKSMRESDRTSQSESNSVSLGYINPKTGQATSRRGSTAKLKDTYYLRLGNQDFTVDKNSAAAIDDQVARILYNKPESDPVYQAFRTAFENTTKQDIVGMNQESFSNFLKTNAGRAFLSEQLSLNTDPNIAEAVYRVMNTMGYLPEYIQSPEQMTDWFGGNPFERYDRPASGYTMEGAIPTPIYENDGKMYKGEDNIIKRGKGQSRKSKAQAQQSNPQADIPQNQAPEKPKRDATKYYNEGDVVGMEDGSEGYVVKRDGNLYLQYKGKLYPIEDDEIDMDNPISPKRDRKAEPKQDDKDFDLSDI